MRALATAFTLGLAAAVAACSTDQASHATGSTDASAGGSVDSGNGAGGKPGTAGGASSGGTKGAGGTKGTGGASTSGGSTSDVDASAENGDASSGGTTGDGGSSSGGATSSGGVASSGGATSSGGTGDAGPTDASTDTCTSESCMPECTSGEHVCVVNSVKVCSSTGHWGIEIPCVGKTCIDGACKGVCTPGTTLCSGRGIQTCNSDGEWGAASACPASPACTYGACSHPSCNNLAPTCGEGKSDDCCAASAVPGGPFFRSYDTVTYTDKTATASVSTFVLDKYEITVGRFRKFVAAWKAGWRPLAGEGKHTHLNAGAGIVGEPGWDPSWTISGNWDVDLLPNGYSQWTSTPGAHESRPINSTSWYEIYAFCIFDGGFLPTEAEWNYAAAGGNDQRVYAWSDPPTNQYIGSDRAVFGGSTSDPVWVGSISAGAGRWGHLDLNGNIYEWVLDVFTAYGTSCQDCANFSPADGDRIQRGGAFFSTSTEALNSNRGTPVTPTSHGGPRGGRCARSP